MISDVVSTVLYNVSFYKHVLRQRRSFFCFFFSKKMFISRLWARNLCIYFIISYIISYSRDPMGPWDPTGPGAAVALDPRGHGAAARDPWPAAAPRPNGGP